MLRIITVAMLAVLTSGCSKSLYNDIISSDNANEQQLCINAYYHFSSAEKALARRELRYREQNWRETWCKALAQASEFNPDGWFPSKDFPLISMSKSHDTRHTYESREAGKDDRDPGEKEDKGEITLFEFEPEINAASVLGALFGN